MNVAEVRPILAQLAGYWPSPALTTEEAAAWTTVLTDPSLGVTVNEARAVIRKASYAGGTFRPRPGQIVAAVLTERRAQCALADAGRMLTTGRAEAVDVERAGRWIAACRRVLAGMSLDEARRLEGVAS